MWILKWVWGKSFNSRTFISSILYIEIGCNCRDKLWRSSYYGWICKRIFRNIKENKLKTQAAKKKILKVIEKVELKDGKRHISIEPNNKDFEVDFQLNYENNLLVIKNI